MAAKANIIIDQGADFSSTITVTDLDGDIVDLTGYTGAGQIRKHYTSETAVDLTIGFSQDRSDGILTIALDSATTASMEAGRYVYDVEITTNGNVTRLAEGIATVTPQVTR